MTSTANRLPDSGTIREFLTATFSDEELTTLCFDHFSKVYDSFASGMTKGQKIQYLIDYCVRRETLPNLLAVLNKQRPEQYARRFGAPLPDQSHQATLHGSRQSDLLMNQQANSPQTSSSSTTHSGGVSANADKLDVGGDVAGRDKIMSAGSHIIHAEAGATATIRGSELLATHNQLAEHILGNASHHAIENPFYTDGRINDPELFFGREQLVRELRQELSKRTNISLVGESQMGKSSLLYYLYATREVWLPGEAIEYLDLQRVFDEADFCEMVLQQLNATGNTLRDLRYTLGVRRVILLLDEVERIAEPDFSTRLHDLLRSLAQEPNFKMCVATQSSLEEVFRPRMKGGISPFHNIFMRKIVGAFTEAEARRFLAARLQNIGITFTERDVVRLINESNCHPSKLQRLAKDLFDQKVRDA